MRERCLLALGTALSLMTATAHADLVGFWKFDGNGSDSSTYGNNATLSNGAGFSATVAPGIGSTNSLSVDGVDDVALVLANASLNTPNFTLSYWINQNGNIQSGPFERVTSRGPSDTFETAVGNPGALSFHNGSVGWNTSSSSLPASGWRHVTWRGEGSNVNLFVDGNLTFTRTGVNLVGVPPSGNLYFGVRHTGNEGFQGLIDNATHYNTALNGGAVSMLANGVAPAFIAANVNQQTIVSNTTNWRLSTVTQNGGASGTWAPGTITLPNASTFTLVPTTSGIAGVVSAAGIMGGGAQPILADNDVRFYRTTFTLPEFTSIAAALQVGADNNVAVFINGQEIARETTFDASPWSAPLPGLTIEQGGGIDGVVKFDSALANFNGFLPGLNEIIVAVRNPNLEGANSGGFAFRLDVASFAVPEPSAIAAWGLLGILGTIAGCVLLRRQHQ